MQIQVNTDDNISGREALARRIETEVRDALDRFGERVTRVELHLADENSGKAGDADKRCTIEARLAGREPVAVTHHASTIRDACNGATTKLQRLLDHTLGRARDGKGRDTVRGG